MSNHDYCSPLNNAGFQWGAAGVGFGQLYFYTGDDGVVYCDNEMMSKDFVKKILCQMVDDAVMAIPNKRDEINET
jgi:hypothetical protein